MEEMKNNKWIFHSMNEIDLKILSEKAFVGLCHALLFQEHGTLYNPLADEGSDSGIDGFVGNYTTIYQFKFFKSRPRPATFLKDIDKVTQKPNLSRWVLVIPDDPTIKLFQLIQKEQTIRQFEVDVIGKTWILAMLNKNRSIQERFFPEVAKEKSVQKIISLASYQARKLNKIEKEIRSRRPTTITVERPLDSLTAMHIKDIKEGVKQIVQISKDEFSYDKIFRQLKNEYGVDNWLLIKDHKYGEIMEWVHNYYYGVKSEYKTPLQPKRKLQGIIKSQQQFLNLSDTKYRELVFKITGKTSTKQMDIAELERVKNQFNIYLGLK